MDEILKKLLESDLLSEEVKAEISTKFKTSVDEYLAEERSKLEVEIRTTLTEEFVKARDELAENVDAKIDQFLTAEFDELVEDVNKFRDLEVEYAEKLVEEKERLAELLGEQLNQLTDKLDAFLEVRLDEEFTELNENIADVKKLEFGRKIFEAVEAEFKKFRRADLSDAEQELAEAQDRLADAERRLADIESARLSEARNAKMDELLTPLNGTAREQMKIILSNVATEKLSEAFNVYIGRVLKEAVVEKKQEPAQKVIVESKPAPAAKVVTGNEDEPTPTVRGDAKENDQLSRMRKLAGVNK